MEIDPPWEGPAVGRADGGGVNRNRRLGKPLETMGRKVLEAAASKGDRASPLTLCPSDCDEANHGKPWDSKVMGPNAGVLCADDGSPTAGPFASETAKKGRIIMKKMLNRALSVLLATLMCAGMVAPGFAASFQELQAAIDGGAGTYGEAKDIVRDANNTITLNGDVVRGEGEANKSITVSGGDKDITIDLNGNKIDGNGQGGSVIQVTDNASLTIQDNSEDGDGTITGGKATFGGGVFVGDHADVKLESGTISGNTSTAEGAGVYVVDGSTFTMNGGEISGNTAKNSGGGVFVANYTTTGNLQEDHSTFTMNGGTITGNTAGSKGGNGGGVAAFGDKQENAENAVVINGGKITNNTTGGNGGGIAVQNGAMSMNGGVITENKGGLGGGVYIYDSEANISGAVISDNEATSGGGVRVVFGETNITDTKITDNTAVHGGGIYAGGKNTNAEIKKDTTVNVSGSEISGNTVASNGMGGGIYSYAEQNSSTMVELTDSTITENEANQGGGVFANSGSSVTLESGSISENEATYGGGVRIHGGAFFTMTGGSITSNTAATSGGGIYSYQGTTVSVTGGEISGNTAKVGGGVYNHTAEFTMTDGRLYGNEGDNHSADLYSTNGTVTLLDISGQGLTMDDGTPITGWLWDGTPRWDADSDNNTKHQSFTDAPRTLCLKAAHDKYYNVSYMDGNTVLQSSDLEKGEDIPAYSGELTRPGYTFAGWLVGGEEFDPATGTVGGDLVLVALWTANPEGGDPVDPDTEIDDQAIPLAAGPVTRAEFVDYLWRHEGAPDPVVDSGLFEDVTEEHEYSPAMAWAKSVGIIEAYEDGTFEPDELVTVSAVRDILDNFAQVFGTNVVAAADLTTLTGDEDEAVLNCDEVLAEFFGEEYASAADEAA